MSDHHVTYIEHLGSEVVQARCCCGWQDPPWSLAGLSPDGLATVERYLDQARVEHLDVARSIRP